MYKTLLDEDTDFTGYDLSETRVIFFSLFAMLSNKVD